MCIVELNVSTLPCRHRWYHLSSPCSTSNNLLNCPAKLILSGWELKCCSCPYCQDSFIDESQYKLIGNDRDPSVSGSWLSCGVACVGPALSSQRTECRSSRRCNMARAENNSSVWTLVRDTGEKNRAQLSRLDWYLSMPLRHGLSTSPGEGDSVCGEERGSLSESATSREADKLGPRWLVRSKRFLMHISK